MAKKDGNTAPKPEASTSEIPTQTATPEPAAEQTGAIVSAAGRAEQDPAPSEAPRPPAGGLRAVSAAPKAEPDTLFVTDTTCTPEYPKRTHVIMVNGMRETKTFEYGKTLEMPAAHAMKFLPTREFIVTDHTGKRYEPVANPVDRHVNITALSPGQVVASLDELTTKALLVRARTLNGGEKFGANSNRDEMAAFIIAATRGGAAPEAAEEMDGDKLGRMNWSPE